MCDPFQLQILETVQHVREWKSNLTDLDSIGFVPTMGALHEGHLNLIRYSLSTQKHTIVSIFINPTQFSPTEDLSSYPSTLDADIKKLTALKVLPGSYQIPHDGFDGQVNQSNDQVINVQQNQIVKDEQFNRVSAVFLPTNNVLYPSGVDTDIKNQRGAFVTVHGLSEQLEGARRPGFFRGVATVVLKLFMIIEPTIAFFGQKDLQQCLVIRQLCKDFHLIRPKSIVAIPTVRETSTGLALSSRNTYLSISEVYAAKSLHEFLQECAKRLMGSDQMLSIEKLERLFNPSFPSISLDFISVNNPITFDQINDLNEIDANTSIAISGAILIKCSTDDRVVRLIDNIVVNYDLNCSI